MTQNATPPQPVADPPALPGGAPPRVSHNAKPFRLVTRADEIFEVNRDWPEETATRIDAMVHAILDFPDEFEVDEKGDPIPGGRLIEEAYYEVVGMPKMILRCKNNDPRAFRVRVAQRPYDGPELIQVFAGVFLDQENRKLYVDRRTFTGKDGPDYKDELVSPYDPESEGLKLFIDKQRADSGLRLGDLMTRNKGVLAWIPAKEVRMVEYQWDILELQQYVELENRVRYNQPFVSDESGAEGDVEMGDASSTSSGGPVPGGSGSAGATSGAPNGANAPPAAPPGPSLFESPR
jgi:hypothetical protein